MGLRDRVRIRVRGMVRGRGRGWGRGTIRGRGRVPGRDVLGDQERDRAAAALLLQPDGGTCLAAQLADHAHDALRAARKHHGARERAAAVVADGDTHRTSEEQRGRSHALLATHIVHLASPLVHSRELMQQRPCRLPPLTHTLTRVALTLRHRVRQWASCDAKVDLPVRQSSDTQSSSAAIRHQRPEPKRRCQQERKDEHRCGTRNSLFAKRAPRK